MEDENRQKVLPKYMKALDGDNKSKEEKDELWQDLIVQSETKLIFIDCHVAWCGPCEVCRLMFPFMLLYAPPLSHPFFRFLHDAMKHNADRM